MIPSEAAMNALVQLAPWRLVREAIKIIEGEKGASCNGRDDCKANPFIRDGRY